MKTLTLERRRELTGTIVTLDGKRAVICGARNPFGTVATLPDGPSFEWSWPTIERIVSERGIFQS